MPDTEQYLERLQALASDKDPIVFQAAAADRIANLILGVSDSRLKARPSPEKWSVLEIIAHLADDELVTSWRYRQMLENPGCAILAFDQDKWDAYGSYKETKIDDTFSTFRLLREANVRLLRRLRPEEWSRFGYHSERGKITIEQLARHMVGHDFNHITQIERLITPAA